MKKNLHSVRGKIYEVYQPYIYTNKCTVLHNIALFIDEVL